LDYPITYYAQNVEGSLRNDISLVRLLFVPLFLNFFDPLRHYCLFSVDLLLQWLNLLVHYSGLGLEDLFEGKPFALNDFDPDPVIRELEPLRQEKFVAGLEFL
jgi:hypothetical protein